MPTVSLFDVRPPMDGETFDPQQDGPRLHRQLATVKAQMAGGRWYSLAELERLTGYPQASISARLRDLRKSRFGGYTVERQRLKDGSGTWFYRVVMP